jgi:hypothetical protein
LSRQAKKRRLPGRQPPEVRFAAEAERAANRQQEA